MNVQPFSQVQGATQAIVPAATSATLTFSAIATNFNCMRIVNKSSVDVACRVGLASTGAVTALLPVPGTPGDMVVASGATEIFSKGYPIDTIAIIGTGAGTGNVYVTPGEGQ
jgi:hypothetical protein